jgi:MFS family permease
MKNAPESNYRWYLLILAALTNAIALAAPSMCLSVLFDEIGRDLNLDLVQIGMAWGIGSLPGIATFLIGGAIGDRFGPKRILIVSCLLAGLSGAARGLSSDFFTLTITLFIFGFLSPLVPMNTIKAVGMWFPRRQLGLANGVLSMGMALGFMLGALISATWLSPMLGGWRNVMLFYGVLSMLLSIPWAFSRSLPTEAGIQAGQSAPSIRQNIAYIASIRRIWLLGLVILCVGGCVQGLLGYLPLYLRGEGWEPAAADNALSFFHLVSLIAVIPIALASDRLGSRKKILVPATLMAAGGTALLALVEGAPVWVAVAMAGVVRDGFMAVFITMIVETEGIGSRYAGTAIGFVLVFSGIGNLFAPALGNSLAKFDSGLPFLFWAGMCLVALYGFYAIKEKRGTELPLADPIPA